MQSVLNRLGHRSLAAALLLVAIALTLSTTLVLAAPRSAPTSLIVDVAEGSSDARDASGPSGGGYFTYSQSRNGNLRIEAALRGVAPNTLYHVTVWCGEDFTTRTAPGPMSAGSPLFHSSEVRTNRAGNANVPTIDIARETLADIPAGCPEGLAHINFQNMSQQGWYLGSPIRFSLEGQQQRSIRFRR